MSQPKYDVVAIGNAAGFVEPLEATALQVICVEASTLADSLVEIKSVCRCGRKANGRHCTIRIDLNSDFDRPLGTDAKGRFRVRGLWIFFVGRLHVWLCGSDCFLQNLRLSFGNGHR